jgi:5-formyltetrahydrofolate cyclo-ligase
VLTYLAFQNELDLLRLIDRLPHIRWAVPRVEGKELALHPYDSEHLIRHHFGMLEPSENLPCISPEQLDVVLTPGLAFDPQGGRLGFGGGFYDRLLVATPAKRVGIAYDCCLADELPMDQHDQRMDWVFTPTQQIECRRATGSAQP